MRRISLTRTISGGSKHSQAPNSKADHAQDPPRAAREGMEWVWIPAGYWAERPQPSYMEQDALNKIFKWKPRRISSDEKDLSMTTGGHIRPLSPTHSTIHSVNGTAAPSPQPSPIMRSALVSPFMSESDHVKSLQMGPSKPETRPKTRTTTMTNISSTDVVEWSQGSSAVPRRTTRRSQAANYFHSSSGGCGTVVCPDTDYEDELAEPMFPGLHRHSKGGWSFVRQISYSPRNRTSEGLGMRDSDTPAIIEEEDVDPITPREDITNRAAKVKDGKTGRVSRAATIKPASIADAAPTQKTGGSLQDHFAALVNRRKSRLRKEAGNQAARRRSTSSQVSRSSSFGRIFKGLSPRMFRKRSTSNSLPGIKITGSTDLNSEESGFPGGEAETMRTPSVRGTPTTTKHRGLFFSLSKAREQQLVDEMSENGSTRGTSTTQPGTPVIGPVVMPTSKKDAVLTPLLAPGVRKQVMKPLRGPPSPELKSIAAKQELSDRVRHFNLHAPPHPKGSAECPATGGKGICVYHGRNGTQGKGAQQGEAAKVEYPVPPGEGDKAIFSGEETV